MNLIAFIKSLFAKVEQLEESVGSIVKEVETKSAEVSKEVKETVEKAKKTRKKVQNTIDDLDAKVTEATLKIKKTRTKN